MGGVMGRDRRFTTEVPCEEKLLIWKIKNVASVVALDNKLEGVKMEFDAGRSLGLSSRWKFYCQQDKLGHIGIFLQLLSPPKERETAVAKFEFSCVSKYMDWQIGSETRTYCTWKSLGNLLAFTSKEHFSKSGYVKNGNLKIHLKFTLYKIESMINRTSSTLARLDTSSRYELRNDFKSLLESGVGADVKLRTKEGKELKAHKAILSARSPVFSAMFQTDMAESSGGVLDILDVSHEAMGIVLKFVYSAKLDDKWDEWIDEVVHAAEKYSLKRLKEYSDHKLAFTCTLQNALELQTLAKLYGLKTAEVGIAAFIKTNLEGIMLESSSSSSSSSSS